MNKIFVKTLETSFSDHFFDFLSSPSMTVLKKSFLKTPEPMTFHNYDA